MRVGVDWGGSALKAAVVDGANVLRHASADTRVDAGPAAILDDIAALVTTLGIPERLGVAIPGEVREDDRCWRLPNVPGFEDVSISAELKQRIGCEVSVENDATAAALAERLYGWGNNYRNFLLVTLGTGIGGGLVLDGHLRRGRGGFAGEIGHVMVNSAPDARVCSCGRRGCLEAYAGKAGLLWRYEQETGKQAGSIREIAESGQADAVWQAMGEALGTALASINNTLDLDAVIFSGGVSGSFDHIKPHIERALKARAFAPPLGDLPLHTSQLAEHAGVIGAAHLP
jgi:glucokinase